MTRIRTLVLGLLVAAAGTARAEDKKPAVDADKVVGTWTLTVGVKDGAKMEKPGGDVTISKEKITLKGPEGMVFEFSYKLDPKAAPVGIDMEILAPEAFKGAKAKGIVSVEGDVFKLAYHPMGGDRPKTFDAEKGSGEYAFEMKKAAAK